MLQSLRASSDGHAGESDSRLSGADEARSDDDDVDGFDGGCVLYIVGAGGAKAGLIHLFPISMGE